MSTSMQEWFLLAMKRKIPEIQSPQQRSPVLNLGAGNHTIDGTTALDLPSWDANKDRIPYKDGSVAAIHAYHFLEHVNSPIAVLMECERVLEAGGVMNICVPYAACSMALHDLTHKHFFNEDTWKVLFDSPYYDARADGKEHDWMFNVNINVIMGIKGSNLALLTQLIKKG